MLIMTVISGRTRTRINRTRTQRSKRTRAETDRERENSNSKTLILKDSSVRAILDQSNSQSLLYYKHKYRETDRH